MIIKFSVGNYRSFNAIQSINFKATGLVSEDKKVDERNIISVQDDQVLRILALYGANGSGKSNVLEGLQVFSNLIINSLESDQLAFMTFNPFMYATGNGQNAGYFQVILVLDGKKFRYGFELNLSGDIQSEWLFGPAEIKETYYFKRTGQEVHVNLERFDEGDGLPLTKLKADTLFLTFCTAYDGEISTLIRDYFKDQIYFEGMSRFSGFFVKDYRGIGERETDALISSGQKDIVLKWLREAGMNYEDVEVETLDSDRPIQRRRVWLWKPVFDDQGKVSGKAKLNLARDESEGSKKFYKFIGILARLFERGGIFVSDEIDSNFHPSLLKKLISLFQDPAVNKANAQLLFTSHDTNLMDHDLMRRDQFYFTEKSLREETRLYSLADLKGIRNNADFARQYLSGIYGAIPILGSYLEEQGEEI